MANLQESRRLLQGIQGTEYVRNPNIRLEKSNTPYPIYREGFVVSPFDEAVAGLFAQLPAKNSINRVVANKITTQPSYLYPDECGEDTIHRYLKSLIGKDFFPLVRSLYNIRYMIDREIPFPQTKVDLQTIIAKLIIDAKNEGMQYVRAALGKDKVPFIGANRIVDMMILDIHEKFPNDFAQLSNGLSVYEMLVDKSQSFETTIQVAERWLELSNEYFKEHKKSPFTAESLAYVQEAIFAYCEHPNDDKTAKDPRARANNALQKYNRDIGSFVVRVSTGEGFFGNQSVYDLIENGIEFIRS